MNELTCILLIFLILIIVLIFIYIYIYNKLQKSIIRINEAETEIDNTLRKKYDLLVQMEKIINDKTNLKQNNFKDLNKKDIKISNFEFDRILSKIYITFIKIKSDYPIELDQKEFRDLMIELKINEEKVESAKVYYNKFTTKLNDLIRSFPSNIVSRIHKIEEHNYFDNKNLNDDDILDFKF